MKRPILFTALLIILSVIVYRFSGIFVFGIFALLGVVVFALFDRKIINIIICFILIFSLFLSVCNLNSKIASAYKKCDSEYSVNLLVVSDKKASENSNYVTVKCVDGKFFSKGTKFNLYYKNDVLTSGDIISADVLFFDIDDDNLYYSSLSSGNFGNLWLKSSKLIGFDSFYSFLGKIREYIRKTLFSNISFDSFATLNAIILGDKSNLFGNKLSLVRDAGVSHIMAVSGMHFAIIMGFLLFFADRLFYNKYLRFVFIVIFSFLLSAVCGFTPSVIRAALMFSLFCVPELFNRDADSLSVLSCAISFILITTPLLIFNISFLMSCLAVLSVMFISPLFSKLIVIEDKGVKLITDMAVVSVFAQIFTSPVAIYYFKRLSLVSAFTNVLISYPVTFAVISALLGLVFSKSKLLSKLFFFVADYIAGYVNYIIEKFGGLKYSAIDVNKIFCIVPVIFIVLTVALVFILKKRGVPNGNSKRRNNK